MRGDISSTGTSAWREELTHVVEGAAGGGRHLQEARVDEGGEGRGRLVFLHGVAGRLALQRQVDRTHVGQETTKHLVPFWN